MANTEVIITEREGGVYGNGFCCSKHPTAPGVWCRKFKDHEGACAAFSFLISEPDTWVRA